MYNGLKSQIFITVGKRSVTYGNKENIISACKAGLNIDNINKILPFQAEGYVLPCP
jgi:hypothetical protein